MALPTQDFTTLMRNQVAAIQAKAAALINFTVGSVLRAIVESNSAVVLWLQQLILGVLNVTRAATSTGADLDSFVADYGVTRLPGVAAQGTATFARFTTTQQVTVPIGETVQTADGSQVFSVIADTAQAAYNSGLNAYVIAVGVSGINVTVKANNAGTGGNVAAAAINTLGSSIPGVDTVMNAAAFTNGIDQETDAALRLRFVAYLSSLSKATRLAIGSAITNVQAGLLYTITENQDYNGATDNGYFYVVFDDGSGNPSAGLISSVYNAVDASRPVGTRFGVFGPTTTTVNVAGTITTAAGYNHATVVGQAQTAVQNYVNGLGLGGTLYYTKLAQIIYEASAGIVGLTGLQVNGATADITATAKQVIRAGTITIT